MLTKSYVPNRSPRIFLWHAGLVERAFYDRRKSSLRIRISGEDCFVVRAHVRDVAEMEGVIDRIVPFGATNSSVVQSTPVSDRLVEL